MPAPFGMRGAPARMSICCLARDVCAGERVRLAHRSLRRSLRHQTSAVPSCARARDRHVIGAADGFFVVLDDQHGVAQIAQILPARSAGAHCRDDAVRSKAHPAHKARRAACEPICVASRMRWPSPPERVAAERSSEM